MAMTVSELEGMPILSVRESPMNGVAGIAKRGLDVAGAVAGILIFGLPMIGIAMAIKFTSPGPVVFRQRRVSVGGEEFEILKFRTMQHVQDENTPATWTARGDARVTKIGSFLRRTSLDELPQLFNVFLGQMSLVGPRPERPELIARFKDDWRGYVLRQHVKAGMTGWAQVNGLRGDTSLRKRLQLDLFYIRNWSLGFDIKILWLTLFRGFAHPNAH
jgi:exopolysaccharide biosynthesis polyprenyl glycosylphosphotransferase